jgi:hypothetical protein
MSRRPTCHPDRPHTARGLCRTCYRRAWRADALPEPLAKPDRPTHSCDYHHGPDRACYAVCGCRCQACLDMHAEYERERRRLMAYGRWQPYVDAGPARRHVEWLIAQGMGKRTIAATAGIRRSTLRDLLAGRPRIRPQTAERLLDVELVTPTVDVDEAIAAVETCRAAGMTTPQIADASGVGLSTLYGWTYRLPGQALPVSVEAVRAVTPDTGTAPPTEGRCVDCAGEPMPGGALRCLPCFQAWKKEAS